MNSKKLRENIFETEVRAHTLSNVAAVRGLKAQESLNDLKDYSTCWPDALICMW